MPRQRSAAAPAVIPTTALVASAARYPGKVGRIYIKTQDWQRECYRHFAICGEARFAAKYMGHAVSRAVLIVQQQTPDGRRTVREGPATVLLAELFAGSAGQEEMLELLGEHLTIAGECYVVGRHDAAGNDVWEVVSVVEMNVQGTGWQINYGDGTTPIDLTEDDAVIRVWIPDPERKMMADSPFRALLPILREIEYLTLHVFSQVRSRLAGAGILFVNQDIDFPPPPDQPGRTDDKGEAVVPANKAEGLMVVLADAMSTAIGDQSHPSAQVPIVVTIPGELVGKAAELMTFWSELDEHSKDLRDEAIQRFALGMDLPRESILGMSSNSGTGGGTSNGVSHWGAWQIEEQTIKLHIEPLLDAIVNALTISFLRPGLSDAGAENLLIWYDLTRLRMRPDRSGEALELYDRGLLKAEVAVRENGFSAEDMMDEAEHRTWLTVKIASGSATPEQVQAALTLLGVQLPTSPIPTTIRETVPIQPDQAPAPQLPPAPSLLDHPENPRTPDERAAAGLVAACDALVYRALEKAGNRLRQQGMKPACPSHETHLHVKANGSTQRILDGAWSCARPVLADLTDEPDKVIEALERYVVTLVNEQSPHSKQRLAGWLELAAAS